MRETRSISSQDNILEFLRSKEFLDIISEVVKKETEVLTTKISELKEEVVILRESNIELVNLLTNTKEFNMKQKKRQENLTSDSIPSNLSQNIRMNTNSKIDGSIHNSGKGMKAGNQRQHTESKESKEDSEWTTVKHNKSRSNGKLQGIIGTGTNNTLKAVEKKTEVYISRLDPETSTEDITAFLNDRFPEIQCENGRSKFPGSYSSFKITINENNFERIMDPKLWPNGIYINKFFRKRKPTFLKNQ